MHRTLSPHAAVGLAWMPRSRRRLRRACAVGSLLAMLAPSLAGATERQAPSLAVLPLKLLDTSNEPSDQSARHAERLARMADGLAMDLSRAGLFRATVLPAERLRTDCPTGEAGCLLQAARKDGAQLIFIGVVHKSSTLILQLWARLVDVRSGKDVFSRDLNFRGDTDEAWKRAETFLVSQIRDGVATTR